MQILYHPRSIKFLAKIPPKDARKVVEAIDKLQNLVTYPNLDVKKLVTTQESFRLRLGNIRVIFEQYNEKKMIYILKIDFRGNVY